jgi:probable blue pigment (indigoidine) exporter
MKEKWHPSALSVTVFTAFAPVSWGTTYLTTTELLPVGRPFLVAFLRVMPAGFFLVLVGRIRSPWRPRGVEVGHTALLGLFNFGLFFPLLAVGVYRLPGGVAAAMGGLQPLLVACLSWVINHERPRKRHLTIGAVAAFGVGLVVVRANAHFDPVGLLAAFAANVSFGCGLVFSKRLPVAKNRISAAGWQLLFGGVVIAGPLMLFEPRVTQLTITNVAGFAYLSLIGTALAFVLWFNGIQRLPVTTPPLLGLAAPITGVTLGWLVLDQNLSPLQIVGLAISMSAITFGTRSDIVCRHSITGNLLHATK